MMDHLDIPNLLTSARHGGENAKAKLLAHYRPYLRLLANLHVRPVLKARFDESDIVQETCMQASVAFHQFQGNDEKQFAAWLRQIMANKGAEMARNNFADKRDVYLENRLHNNFERSSLSLARIIPDKESSPSRAVMRRERSVLLADAISRMSGEKREVLILHGLQGKSIAEVAETMGRTEASTWKLWARGLQELKRITTELQ